MPPWARWMNHFVNSHLCDFDLDLSYS
uniref:Uncharacterized protein n=1 Tax=Arundo donax TaxID=35708 RepID=A0A0A9BEU5_ARUDO